MKKVLIIAGVFPPEPIVSANLMFDLATELSKDNQVTVLRPCPSRPMGFKFEEYDNSKFQFKVIELSSYIHPKSDLLGRLRESVSFGLQAAKYVASHYEEIDFIYNDPWQLFGVNIVARTARKYKIPYMMAVQDIYPESITSKLPKYIGKAVTQILLPIDKYNQSNAAKIHTISNNMVEYLSKTRKVPKDKYICVRNWQNEDSFINRSIGNKDNSLFTFMYLGNVGPLAGLEIVIKAFSYLKDKNVRLVIAGSGSAKIKLMQMREVIDSDKIEFWDVPDGKVPEIQSKADVMVLPVKKGFAMSSIPSKLPAYMFSAKPILASVDCGSDTAKCITESDSGWVIEPENIEKLYLKMKDICNESFVELRKKGKRGQEFALRNLSKSGNVPVLIESIKKIIK